MWKSSQSVRSVQSPDLSRVPGQPVWWHLPVCLGGHQHHKYSTKQHKYFTRWNTQIFIFDISHFLAFPFLAQI